MTDPITRLNAALEGRYAIERELSEGRMATVYLGDDLRHEHSKYAPISEDVVAPTRRSLL